MNAKDIEVWMIGIPTSEVSRIHMDAVLPSWAEYNVNIFEAITPSTLSNYSELDFDKRRYTDKIFREFSTTEKAVWYSHYLLWKKCWDEKKPLIIIEHDSILRKDIGEVGRNKLLSYLTDRKPTKNDPLDNGLILSPGSGYVIFPEDILPLINYCNSIPIGGNVDGYIREYIQSKYGWPTDFGYIEQIVINNMTTIEHRVNKTTVVVPE